MKWAILLYATLLYPNRRTTTSNKLNHPFKHMSSVKHFIMNKKENPHKGVINHGKDKYHPEIQLLEMGCAKGVIKAKGEKSIMSGEVILIF